MPMEEPYKTLYMTLRYNDFPLDQWRYYVKMHGNAILIGTPNHHWTVLDNVPGWHVTINGIQTNRFNDGFEEFLQHTWDATMHIVQAQQWFRMHAVRM